MRNRNTKLVLIETAERLFAEQGIEGVSLRQITVAAKQKNTSALHYHFGSRQNLIEAIFALRTSRINERRLQMLADVHEKGHSHDLRELVAVRVCPLAERLISSGGLDYYVRFLAQANLSPQVDVNGILRGRFDEGMVRTSRLIHQILSYVPRAVLDQRLLLSSTQMTYALAEWQTSMTQSGADIVPGLLMPFVDNLIDFIKGGLSVSPTEGESLIANQVLPLARRAQARKPAAGLSEKSDPRNRKADTAD
jgi:AcrR family transcriptional regulator